MPQDSYYGSNSIPLTAAALLTDGDLLELGMGLFSTPLLHEIAADSDRNLVSIDTDPNWLKKFITYLNLSMI